MSVIAAIIIVAQSVSVQTVQMARYNLSDCGRTVFIPMNFDAPQRPVDKRVRGKLRPMQKQQPSPRPCLTRASG
jgi:hypothetical protein